MGLCFSCCMRRKPSRDSDDREPLLPRTQQQQPGRISTYSSTSLPPPRTPLEKLADVVAALEAGKLPSQEQLNRILKIVINSEIFNTSDDRHAISSPAYTGTLGEEMNGAGKRVVESAREACQAALRFGLEKNDDNRIQDLVYQLRRITSTPVYADIAVETTNSGDVNLNAMTQELPSQDEASSDAKALLRSAFTLAYILVTSTAFRLILADVLLVARETVADIAARLEHVSGAVEKVAKDVEQAVRPGGGTVEDVKEKASEVSTNFANEIQGDGAVSDHLNDIAREMREKKPEEVKRAAIQRLQEAIAQAHRQPSFQGALRTILTLFHKYTSKIRAAAAVVESAKTHTIKVTPLLWADPPFSRALLDVQQILERIASGRSLDRLLASLRDVVYDIATAPAIVISDSPSKAALRDWFEALGDWLERSLDDPAYATSSVGTVRADILYDEARRIVNEAMSEKESQWVRNVQVILTEVESFAEGLQNDRTTQLLVDSFSKLVSCFGEAGATIISNAPGLVRDSAERAKRETYKGLVMWLLPHILRTINTIPMPRVEYVDDTIEAAVDALLLTAPHGSDSKALRLQASLIPDKIKLQTWNEVSIDIDNLVPSDDDSNGSPSDGRSSLAKLVAGSGHFPARSSFHTPHTTSKTRTQTKTRAHLHIEGMRVAAHDVSYYVHYKGTRSCGMRLPCTSYKDEGLIDVDVGSHSGSSIASKGTGLSMDVGLEFDTSSSASGASNGWLSFFTQEFQHSTKDISSSDADAPPLFKVTDVRVDVPGLHVRLKRSRHWLLNSLLVQPLAGPVARAAAAWVLRGQIRATLEALASFGGRVRAKAHANANEMATGHLRRDDTDVSDNSATLEDWWTALVGEVGLMGQSPGHGEEDGDDDSDDEDSENSPLIHTRTRATVQGIVRKTVTQTAPESEPEASVLAVGIGAQVLPHKGGPYGASTPQCSSGFEDAKVRATEEARKAVADVAEAEAGVEEELRTGLQRAARIREELVETGSRSEVRARVERRRKGWRSAVFDFPAIESRRYS